MIDLNDLKGVNDAGGHGAGDQFIQAIAQALLSHLPDDAIVGRWGGDEFVAMIPHVSEHQALEFAHAAQQALPRRHCTLLPFSAGVASMRADDSLERVLATADQRMYESKQAHYELSHAGAGQRGNLSVEDFSRQLELLEMPQEVLDVGLSLARELLGFEATAYYEPHKSGLLLTHLSGLGDPDWRALQALDVSSPNPGMVSAAMESNTTTWTADYPTHQNATQAWIDFGLKSAVATPVRFRGEVIGALTLMQFSTWRSITPGMRRLLETVALRLGHTLKRVRVKDEVRVTSEGGLFSMGLALEARDLETSGHTDRVVRMSVKLGQILNLNPCVVSDLR